MELAKNHHKKPNRTNHHATRYFFVGVSITIFNYVLYAILSNLIIKNHDLLWLCSLISTVITTIVAYFAHSKITWKDRDISQSSIIKFFIWNALLALIISPSFTQFFSLFTPLYEFAFNLTSALHLPFSYDFVLTTGAFAFTSIVIMIINFLFYDKFVFPKSVPEKSYPYTAELQKAKVSVIIPIYNTSKYLPACLDSVLTQTHQNLEIILVDDGSTDDSSKIADDYAKKDQRIKVIHQKNGGQSSARNRGLKEATGEYLCFIDSDDIIDKDFVKELLSPYKEKNFALSVCGMHYKRLKQKSAENVYINSLRPRRKTGSQKAYILYLLAIDGRLYSSVNKLFQTKIAKKCSFNESLNFSEDSRFVLNYLKQSTGEIAFILKPLYIYNFGTETSTIKTSATKWQNWQDFYIFLKTWLGKNPSLSEKFWLHAVHLRWRISYVRSRRRAKQS